MKWVFYLSLFELDTLSTGIKMPPLAYVATLNNPTATDLATLRTPSRFLEYIIIGEEIGKLGTPHLQIYFQLATPTKVTKIKNWGGPWARMHLEIARGTSEEAAAYCKKDGIFHEIGVMKMMGGSGQNAVKTLRSSHSRTF